MKLTKTQFRALVVITLLIIIALCVIIGRTTIKNGLETDIKEKQDSILLLKKQNDNLQKDLLKLESLSEKLWNDIKKNKKQIIIIDSIYDENADHIINLNADKSIEYLSNRLSEKSGN